MLNARLVPLGPWAVAVEATGGFESVVAASLGGAGLPVIVVNPAQVRAFANALGKRAKTDPIDAAVIARFVEATRPEIRPLPDADTRLLAELVARRRQIIQMIVAERQREKQIVNRALRKSVARLVLALTKELNVLDTASTMRCAARRPGARAKTCCAAFQALVPSWRAPSSPRCRSWTTRPPPGRELGGLGTLDPAVGQMARQELHRRRTTYRAHRRLHGRHGRQTLQPRPQSLPSAPHRRRKTQNGRHHRCRQEAPHHPQRHPQRQKTMANRLTHKTVASPRSAARRSAGDDK